MHLIANCSLLLAAIALGFLVFNLLSKRKEHKFYWHRLCDCNNFYAIAILPDGVKYNIEMFVVDKRLIKNVIVEKINSYYFKITIPKGMSLDRVMRDVCLNKESDSTIVSLFSSINRIERLDNLFSDVGDKHSCLEMFGYLKRTLQCH